MTQYGQEAEIAYPDINTQVETMRSYKDHELMTSFRRISVSIKVDSMESEAEAFAEFSDLLQAKKRSGRLLYKHSDPSMLPVITIKYPKVDHDGSWFVVTTYTELVL